MLQPCTQASYLKSSEQVLQALQQLPSFCELARCQWSLFVNTGPVLPAAGNTSRVLWNPKSKQDAGLHLARLARAQPTYWQLMQQRHKCPLTFTQEMWLFGQAQLRFCVERQDGSASH